MIDRPHSNVANRSVQKLPAANTGGQPAVIHIKVAHSKTIDNPQEACKWFWTFFRDAFPRSLAACVMPDHVHVLLEGARDDADLIGAVHAWKQSTAFTWKRRTGTRLWQKNA